MFESGFSLNSKCCGQATWESGCFYALLASSEAASGWLAVFQKRMLDFTDFWRSYILSVGEG